MHVYSLGHVSDSALLQALATLVRQDRTTTASLLANIAEVDARKLYVPTGHPSMFEYCVEELRLSEDAAYRRIRAARAAREFPVLFAEVAEGRLHQRSLDVLAGLRSLGCRPHEARRAAEFSGRLEGASLEERMRAALSFLGRRSMPGHAIR
jgi:hypothetical protein